MVLFEVMVGDRHSSPADPDRDTAPRAERGAPELPTLATARAGWLQDAQR